MATLTRTFLHGAAVGAVFLTVPVACDSEDGPDADDGLWETQASDLYASERLKIVRTLRAEGIRSPDVLKAMMAVVRHAYLVRPLPIGHDQTISSPYILAYMSEAADIVRSDKVLEIGTGSGYQAAVLAELSDHVFSIEIIPELAEQARSVLEEQGYADVRVRTGNGYLGWPEEAPYDAIVFTAAPAEVPQALVDQLALNGIMVIPVGVGS